MRTPVVEEITPVDPASTVLLLGAGASADAAIPTSFEMTEQLVKAVSGARYSQTALALNYVCGALLAYDTSRGNSGAFDGLDIERVFSAVGTLAERHRSELAPFVGSWQSGVDAFDRPTLSTRLDHTFQQAIEGRAGASRRLPQEIQKLVRSVAGEGDGHTYTQLADQMIRSLRVQVDVDEASVGYLAPLVRAGNRNGGITVATLNYDLTIEKAAADARCPLDTGVKSWIETGDWAWHTDGVRLMKLHGSIDWCWQPDDYEPGQLRGASVRVTDDPQHEDRKPVLLFGHRGKLTAEGPFLSLLGEFSLRLREATTLLVIGYSFRDEHINALVAEWLRNDRIRNVVVVDPTFPAFHGPDPRSAFFLPMVRRASEEPARVTVVRQTACAALRSLFPLL